MGREGPTGAAPTYIQLYVCVLPQGFFAFQAQGPGAGPRVGG